MVVDIRMKLSRNSFTDVGPKTLVLFITACWARVGVTDGNPGTLALGKGLATVESSK